LSCAKTAVFNWFLDNPAKFLVSLLPKSALIA
jgi:hypothetical protein